MLRVNASVAGFTYAGFIGMFALDAPSGLATLIHLLPGLIVVAACIAGLKNALAGAVSAGLLALGFTFFFHTYLQLTSFLLITGPLIIVAALYSISAVLRETKAS